MKIVIDTGIVISAAIRDRKPSRAIDCIVDHMAVGWQWVASTSILEEYVEVLRRPKFGLAESTLAEWAQRITDATTLVDVPVSDDFPRDPDDAKFLACALACEADWLITGDRDFEEARRLGSTQIVTVDAFLRLMCEE